MQQETRTLTGDVVRQIFIDSLAAQHLTWEHDDDQKRMVAECIADPLLQKLSEVLNPVLERLQQEGALLDKRRTAINTEQAVQVLEKIMIRSAMQANQLRSMRKKRPSSINGIAPPFMNAGACSISRVLCMLT